MTRLFDGLVMAFDQNGEPVYGRLNTDRPHQIKLLGSYQLPTRTILSGVFRAASGIPITRQVNMISSLPVFYLGRQSDGRTPWLSVFDLSVQQDIPLGGRLRGQVSVNVLNLFDQKEVTDVFRVGPGRTCRSNWRSSSPASTLRRASTRCTSRATRGSCRIRYWQTPREIRFGFKMIF